jgi:hypothetical protein
VYTGFRWVDLTKRDYLEDPGIDERIILRSKGRLSSVVIATGYGMNGPGIESRWRRDFPHPARPALEPTQTPTQWVPGVFPGVKRLGRGFDYLGPSKAEVKEIVELYI